MSTLRSWLQVDQARWVGEPAAPQSIDCRPWAGRQATDVRDGHARGVVSKLRKGRRHAHSRSLRFAGRLWFATTDRPPAGQGPGGMDQARGGGDLRGGGQRTGRHLRTEHAQHLPLHRENLRRLRPRVRVQGRSAPELGGAGPQRVLRSPEEDPLARQGDRHSVGARPRLPDRDRPRPCAGPLVDGRDLRRRAARLAVPRPARRGRQDVHRAGPGALQTRRLEPRSRRGKGRIDQDLAQRQALRRGPRRDDPARVHRPPSAWDRKRRAEEGGSGAMAKHEACRPHPAAEHPGAARGSGGLAAALGWQDHERLARGEERRFPGQGLADRERGAHGPRERGRRIRGGGRHRHDRALRPVRAHARVQDRAGGQQRHQVLLPAES